MESGCRCIMWIWSCQSTTLQKSKKGGTNPTKTEWRKNEKVVPHSLGRGSRRRPNCCHPVSLRASAIIDRTLCKPSLFRITDFSSAGHGPSGTDGPGAVALPFPLLPGAMVAEKDRKWRGKETEEPLARTTEG